MLTTCQSILPWGRIRGMQEVPHNLNLDTSGRERFVSRSSCFIFSKRTHYIRSNMGHTDASKKCLFLPVIELQSSGLQSIPAMIKLNLWHTHTQSSTETGHLRCRLPDQVKLRSCTVLLACSERWCKWRHGERRKPTMSSELVVSGHYRSLWSVRDNYQEICNTRNCHCYTSRLMTEYCTNLLCILGSAGRM
jgi:hypothetical protein